MGVVREILLAGLISGGVGLLLSVLYLGVRVAVRIGREGPVPEFGSPLSYRITVPAGIDGRPGETFLAPSESRYIGVINSDASRSDCAVRLGPGSRLLVVCFGPVAARGTAADSAAYSIEAMQRRGAAKCTIPPTPTKFAGLPATTYTLHLRGGRILHELKFEHNGWLYGVGILTREEHSAAAREQAGAILRTWQWLDGSRPSAAQVSTGAVSLIRPT
ncbi:MAG: hypothetical protein ABIM89_12505 [Mycobacteriales bacterium]